MSITKTTFGATQNGEAAELYTLSNSSGARAEILTLGGAIHSLWVPDRTGTLADVALGYDTPAAYERNAGYLGALIGRFGNRIRRGRFTLDGADYQLFCNDGKNHLHGGRAGYDKRIWSARVEKDELRLSLHSPDGEEGYPGALDIHVTYRFSEDNELSIDYRAVTNKPTILNLTNHCYFNLAGQGSPSVLAHQLRLHCEQYTENDAECVPTGVVASVENTPMDFRQFHTLGGRIDQDDIQLRNGGGYDHNFVISGGGVSPGRGLLLAAELWDEESGRLLEAWTTQPGVQIYTGNFLDGAVGKGGCIYPRRCAVCLETQAFPNAMEYPHFPNVVLRPGQEYHHTTLYRFALQ